MRRRTSLVFQTKRQKSRAARKKTVLILLAVLIAAGSVSSLLFLKNYNYDLKNAFGGEQQTEESTETPKREIQDTCYDVLLYCISSDYTRTDFLCLMRIKLPENRITLFPFSPSDQATVEGKTATYADFLKNGGGSALMKAVEARMGIHPSCYIGATEDKFKAVIDRYGGFDFTINESVDVRGDGLTLVLPQGTQNLHGEQLLKYFRYLTFYAQNGYLTQGDLIATILKNFFIPEKVETMQTVFAYLANQLTTDISIVTFTEASANLTSLMECGEIQYVTVQSAQDYAAS